MTIKVEVIVPCTNCIAVPICRYKQFDELARDCKLVIDNLYFDRTSKGGLRSKHFADKMLAMERDLKPEKWAVEIDGNGFAHIMDKTLKPKLHIKPPLDEISNRFHQIETDKLKRKKQ